MGFDEGLAVDLTLLSSVPLRRAVIRRPINIQYIGTVPPTASIANAVPVAAAAEIGESRKGGDDQRKRQIPALAQGRAIGREGVHRAPHDARRDDDAAIDIAHVTRIGRGRGGMRDGTQRGDGVDRRGGVVRTGEKRYSRYLRRIDFVIFFD